MNLILQFCFFDQTGCHCPANGRLTLGLARSKKGHGVGSVEKPTTTISEKAKSSCLSQVRQQKPIQFFTRQLGSR